MQTITVKKSSSVSPSAYGVSTEEVERSIAAVEEMDPEEMEQVAGGESDSKCHMVFGWFDGAEDEYGHSVWCYTAWHCETLTLHTSTKSKLVKCFSNYSCHNLSEKY